VAIGSSSGFGGGGVSSLTTTSREWPDRAKQPLTHLVEYQSRVTVDKLRAVSWAPRCGADSLLKIWRTDDGVLTLLWGTVKLGFRLRPGRWA
jgi:hypothetical protein